MNHVTLKGRLGRDAETKAFVSGNSVTEFSLATDDGYKKKDGEKVERTSWHTVKMFGKRGEALARHLTKGKEVLVTGRIEYRTWDKDDGTKGYATDIVMGIGDTFEFCGSKVDPASSPSDNSYTPAAPNADDVPF
jgi:single-strand DNA-binding protein